MRKIVFALVIAVLPAYVAAAEQSSRQPGKSANSGTLHPVKSKSCAEYGPGFVKIEGSNVCIKIGGSVSVEAGANMRR